MAGRGTDILLGGNPEFMTRQQCLAEQIAERLPKGEERFVEDEQFVYFYHIDAFYRVPKVGYERIFAHFKKQCDEEHDEVVALDGLHIVATERHEARRIDNQLRGRAGRQGDPGASRFYLSLQDDLMRIFGSDRISGLMQKLGMEEGVPIEHGMVTRAIERAQKQVEGQNFSVRKHLLEYDDVMNKQRENIYALRREILEGRIRLGENEEDIVGTREYLMTLAEDILDSIVDTYADARPISSSGTSRALKQEVEPDLRDRRRPARLQRPDGRRDPRPVVGAHPRLVRGKGKAGRARDPAADRARHHAPDRRHAVEGSPLQPRSPEGRHRPPRLRTT